MKPITKKILCFGDSLTWGNYYDGKRFDIQDRWTHRLQVKLGDGYDVIEQGLRSRTVNITDPDMPGRNGFEYFCPCIESLGYVDLLILWLGTNDTKMKFQTHADTILSGLKLYVDFIRSYNQSHDFPVTEIILMSPPKIRVDAFAEDSSFDPHSTEILDALNMLEKSYCEKNGICFINLYDRLIGNIHDGIHLEVNDNEKISQLLFEKIHTISL